MHKYIPRWPSRRHGAHAARLLASVLCLLAGLLAGAPAAYAAPGDLDTTFGGAGIVTTTIGSSSTAEDVAAQADGKLVVAGHAAMGGTANDIAVARYNVDGSLDTSFGTGGIVTTDIGTSSTDYAHAVVLTSDNKIVVVGSTDANGTGNDFAVVRYDTNGDLDPTFGDDGIVTTHIGSASATADDSAWAATVQEDGKLLVAGVALMASTGYDFTVVRYDTNGNPDPTFDGDGIVTTAVDNSTTNASDQAYAVALQSSGKIIVGGYAQVTGTGWDLAVLRYNSDGMLDTTFGGGGSTAVDLGAPSSPTSDMGYDVVVGSDDKIVIAGYGDMPSSGSDIALVRLTSDGVLDTTFNGNGIVTDAFAPGEGKDVAQAVQLQNNGKIVVAGYAQLDGSTEQPLFARYETDGQRDTTFGALGGGAAVSPAGWFFGGGLAADGQIIGVGMQDGHFLVARVDGDPAAAELTISADEQMIANGQIQVPILLNSNGMALGAVAFSLDYDQNCLTFDMTDGTDSDTLPDAVSGVPAGFDLSVVQDLTDIDGELDVSLTDTTVTIDALPDGEILSLAFGVTGACLPTAGNPTAMTINFSTDPAASFGSVTGQEVPGTATGATISVKYNSAPTDITLTPSAIDENAGANTVVGTLAATDLDTGDTHTFELVSGTGDTDNASFTIVNDQLQAVDSFNYEAQAIYSVRVQATDNGGLTFVKVLTIDVNDVNEAPTDIQLDPGVVDDNAGAGAIVGTLSATDPESGDSHTFGLVAGDGDTDNGAFTVVEDQVQTVDAFNYGSKTAYTIRVQASDNLGLTFEKALAITVNDVNEAPTDITLSPASIDENSGANAIVGTLAATDPDAGDTHTFALAAGTGDTDNTSFIIIGGNQVQALVDPDYETQASYSIYVEVTDQGGKRFGKALQITVKDVNEAPTAVDDTVDPATTVFFGSGGGIAVLDNDSDPESTLSLRVSSVGTPGSGTATTDGTVVTFDPPDTSNGTTSFSYTVSDNDAGGPLTDEGLVTVTYVANDARGDCNADGQVSAADFVATVLENFDNPADAPWWTVYAAGFAGSPLGCDSNADRTPDIADLICTVRLFFGDTCTVVTAASQHAAVDLAATLDVQEEAVLAQLRVGEGSEDTAALAFRLRYNPADLKLSGEGAGPDGLPAGVTVTLPPGVQAWVDVDEAAGEVLVAIAAVSYPIQTLPTGALMTLRFARLSAATPVLTLRHLSAGTADGIAVPLRAIGDIREERSWLYLPAARR